MLVLKNKKGFSLVEVLATIAILGILTGISIIGYTRYVDSSKRKSYAIMVSSAQTAMKNYSMDFPNAKEVTFQELVDGGYLSSPVDPGNKDTVCRGKVFINPDVTLAPTSQAALQEDNYKVSICCSNNFNYTYESNGVDRSVDKYCKVDPYDISQIKNIKVLNVYPNASGANNLKNWMTAYGKGLINVTPVYIDTFNANPATYIGTNGNWNYDEIVFGFWDCNSSKDLSATASALVDEFLNRGGAAIFGHDTITANGCGSHVNFNKLAKHVNLTLHSGVSYQSSTQVKIHREGVFTKYPYQIGNIGTVLTIPKSHVYGQEANGDVWITFTGGAIDSDLPANKIYLSTYGNNAFIQTGHSNGEAKEAEQKIIANIIFYMIAKQYVE